VSEPPATGARAFHIKPLADEHAGGPERGRPQRLGVSQSTTAPWTLEQDAAAYAAAGVGAIGVWLQKLEQGTMGSFWFPEKAIAAETIDAAADVIRSAGLSISHLIVAGRYTEYDDELRRRRIEHSLTVATIANALGANCVVVIPGRLNGLSQRRALELASAALGEVLERTEDMGVRFAVEPVMEVDFAGTLAEANDLLDVVDHPRLGVFPDSYHLWRDASLAEELARAGTRIFGVHVADADRDHAGRLPPGEGVVPLGDFVRAVEAAGYSGTYDVELFAMGSSDAEAGDLLARSVAGLRQLLDEAL